MSELSRREVSALWDSAPVVECKGLCHDSCGPVSMTLTEAQIIEQHTGEPLLPVHADFTCPYLTAEKRCSIYEVRPYICRIFGAVRGLECPHGCTVRKRIPEHQNNNAFRRFSEATTVSTQPAPLIPSTAKESA